MERTYYRCSKCGKIIAYIGNDRGCCELDDIEDSELLAGTLSGRFVKIKEQTCFKCMHSSYTEFSPDK